MSVPAVSVVISAYNRAATIGKAVRSALVQDYAGHYEIIVVDDGSTDSTPEILTDYGQKIRVVRQPNRGRSAARNSGVWQAAASLVAFLDSDDYWLSTKLGAVVKTFEERPDTGLVYSDYYEADSTDGRLLGRLSFPDNPRIDQMFARLECVGIPSNVAVRRAIFEQVGGFDERLHWGEDIDLYLRLRRVCSFSRIPEPLLVYRKRMQLEESIRAYSLENRATFEHVMREHFGRRANRLINHTRDQRAAGLLTLGLMQFRGGERRKALTTFVELAMYRPFYAPRVIVERVKGRARAAS
jgi:glycosyltransferase involved in cell wall biosynthesis